MWEVGMRVIIHHRSDTVPGTITERYKERYAVLWDDGMHSFGYEWNELIPLEDIKSGEILRASQDPPGRL
jgi:hypothetical protein